MIECQKEYIGFFPLMCMDSNFILNPTKAALIFTGPVLIVKNQNHVCTIIYDVLLMFGLLDTNISIVYGFQPIAEKGKSKEKHDKDEKDKGEKV